MNDVQDEKQRQHKRRHRLGKWVRHRLPARHARLKGERRDLARARAEVERHRRAGEKPPDELIAARNQARDEYLEARRRHEEAQDRIAAIRATIARGARRLKRLRSRAPAGPVIPRASWGAAPPRGSYSRNVAVTRRVQHHTAGSLPPASASVSQEAAEMREIQRQHLGQGWTDIGYHRVVMPSGRIYEGRPSWAIGAHVLNNNTGTVGVSAAGNYETAMPTPMLVAACRDAFKSLPGAGAPLFGHCQLNPTACPGKNLKPKLKEIA